METSVPQNPTSLSGTIERFDSMVAIILLANGERISWPIKQLPDGCQVGAAVRVQLFTAASEVTERQAVAKSILNEILKGDDSVKEK